MPSLPTGIPMVRELDKNLKPLQPVQFQGDEEAVSKATEAVAAGASPTGEREQAAAFPCPVPFLCPSSLHLSHGPHLWPLKF